MAKKLVAMSFLNSVFRVRFQSKNYWDIEKMKKVDNFTIL